MRRSVIKIVLATLGFAVIHSALASRQAKDGAARLFGARARNGGYRVFYLAQSFLTGAALIFYLRRIPDQVIYRVSGAWARLMNLGQAAGLLYAVYAALQVGVPRILGLASLAAWLRDDQVVPPEPEAQGPSLAVTGQMRATGPFAWSRHPLNFAPLPVFWLAPAMTLKLLVFNLAATAYLVLGSVHEEARLRAAYGAPYQRYLRSGVSFYVPLPGAGLPLEPAPAAAPARAQRPVMEPVPPA